MTKRYEKMIMLYAMSSCMSRRIEKQICMRFIFTL